MKKFNMAIIGCGGRGRSLTLGCIQWREFINIVAVCDEYEDKAQKLADELVEKGKNRPKVYTNYEQCVDNEKLDCILVATAWEAHIKVSTYAMEKGITVACEVGGAYSINSLWELVRCYERTKTPIMLLENCCYGRLELLALNMKRQGLFGKVVHCEGAYNHDLRREVTEGKQRRHYRLLQYIHRNTENYPTHEIGPIAKLLDITFGNRFTTLYAVSSGSYGLKEFVKEKNLEDLKDVDFKQGDVITTIMQCQNGETVTINLNTTLPRPYSRGFLVEGTKGMLSEDNNSVCLEKDFETTIPHDWTPNYNNMDKYYEKYEHRLWKGFVPNDDHGGIDNLVFDSFFDSLVNNKPMAIDVYEMATWMAISVLAEQSIQTGQSIPFPDFTDGKWIFRKNEFEL